MNLQKMREAKRTSVESKQSQKLVINAFLMIIQFTMKVRVFGSLCNLL